MKTFGYLVTVLIGISLLAALGIGIRAVFLPARAIDRSLSTVEGVVDKTLTADNAIYNYEWFKQQKEDISAIESKIEIAQTSLDTFISSAGPRKDWTFEDKSEAARLGAIKQGLQSQYQDMIANYNARSKMANRSIFLDGKIPSVIQMGSNFLR